MNEFFNSLAQRWTAAAERRGVKIDAPELDAKVADELLQLAAVVSHTKERRFAPLATYTAGVAVGRLREAKDLGADALAEYIREVRLALERESPPGSERTGG